MNEQERAPEHTRIKDVIDGIYKSRRYNPDAPNLTLNGNQAVVLANLLDRLNDSWGYLGSYVQEGTRQFAAAYFHPEDRTWIK